MVRTVSTFITALQLVGRIPCTLYISYEVKIADKNSLCYRTGFLESMFAKTATHRLITPFPAKPLLAEMQSVFSRLHWIEDRYGS
jgi:hypothetical protein